MLFDGLGELISNDVECCELMVEVRKNKYSNVCIVTLERYHRTYREKDKVMCGLGNNVTAKQMNDNIRTYYNFVRDQTLENKTPAEMAGINLTSWKKLMDEINYSIPLNLLFEVYLNLPSFVIFFESWHKSSDTFEWEHATKCRNRYS